MKLIRLSITLLGLIFTTLAFSQISHGGSPYFLQNSLLRAASKPFFIEMPSFNLDSLLRGEGDKGENMRGGYKFAHKFLTDISINDAVKTVLEDGTVVKQIGIRSAGAYSINLLLRDFDIPKGGKLFIFSYDRSHVLGSFDHRNNNPEKVLPIQPVTGDAVIIEYSEPSNTSFSGQFTVSEVNHDYRDIFRVEPKPDHNTYYNCMPDVFCENVIKETIRSTVLLIFNGNVFCSGSIITDASAGGEPYLLTAAHCFGTNSLEYPKDKDFHIQIC